MASSFTKVQFWAELDHIGEEQVRINVNRRVYGSDLNDKCILAREWLRQRDQERSDASQSESLEIARSAKDAAWAAAEAAREAAREASSANRLAKIALSVAIIIPALIAYFD